MPKAATPPPEPVEPATPVETGNDPEADVFYQEWEDMKAKVANILEEIRRNTSGGNTAAPTQSSGASSTGAPTGQSQPSTPTSERAPEKKPKSIHWYFREFGKRN